MPDIFISYSQKDKPFVSKLAAALERAGYDVWWDVELIAGQDWSDSIHEKISQAKNVITVWSKNSVSRPWVKAESNLAIQRQILVPIRIDDTDIPMPFCTLQTEDFSRWNGRIDAIVFKQLLQGLYHNFDVDASQFIVDSTPAQWKKRDFLMFPLSLMKHIIFGFIKGMLVSIAIVFLIILIEATVQAITKVESNFTENVVLFILAGGILTGLFWDVKKFFKKVKGKYQLNFER